MASSSAAVSPGAASIMSCPQLTSWVCHPAAATSAVVAAAPTSLTVPLTDGTHYLHASYGGDGHYSPYQSSPVTVTVGPAAATRPARH
jgi:hypothetical protein